MSTPLPRQSANDDGGSPSVNPSLVVGLCILGAMFFCVLLASVIRLCNRMPTPKSYAAEDPPQDLFRPYSQDQVERMREVRWLNHSEMWEAAKQARMELGERFGPKPEFRRRTGVGWGFVVGKDGYMRRARGNGGEGGGSGEGEGLSEEDAWSSLGTSGDGRESSMAGDDANLNSNPHLNSHAITDRGIRASYYSDGCDPNQCPPVRKPVLSHNQYHQYQKTYEELDREGEEQDTQHGTIAEPFPEMPRIPGIEQRFEQGSPQQSRGRIARMVRNDDIDDGVENGQVRFIGASGDGKGEGAMGNELEVGRPRITLNDGSVDLGRDRGLGYRDGYGYEQGHVRGDGQGNGRHQDYAQCDGYGSGQSTEMRDLTAPHAM